MASVSSLAQRGYNSGGGWGSGPAAPSSASGSSKWRLGGGFSLVSKSTIKYDDANSIVLGPVTADVTYKSGFSFDLELRNLQQKSWGFIGMVNYEPDKEMSEAFYRNGTGTFQLNITNPAKLQTTTLQTNAAYRWGSFYIPVGINYAFFKVTPSSSGVNGKATGGLGCQAGLGYIISDRFIIETTYRQTAIKLEEDYGSGLVDRFDKGSMMNTHLSLRTLW